MSIILDTVEALGLTHPATFLALFLCGSLLMIWRLEALMAHGLEGTALGTLVTPYCSGLGNLVFVYLMLRDGGDPLAVMTNCLVNNTTNLTLVLALPAIFWGLELVPTAKAGAKKGGAKKTSGAAQVEQQISRFTLLMTLLAVMFFTGAVWALGADGRLDEHDGLVLVGLFVFWQCFQVFDVLKHNVRKRAQFGAMFYLDLCVLLLCAGVLYTSLEWLVEWLKTQKTGVLSAEHLGWLSGWLMVLPNAMLALYYGAKRRADIVYASQVGDGHICIPLCIGIFATFKSVPVPGMLQDTLLFLLAAAVVHFGFIVTVGRLPRWAGVVLLAGYGGYVALGF